MQNTIILVNLINMRIIPLCHVPTTSASPYFHTKGLGTAGGGVILFTPTDTPVTPDLTRWGMAAEVRPGKAL